MTQIIAIASGKGGVGKSLVTASLAAELTENNYSVGIIDADIYGSSQATLLGVGAQHAVINQAGKIEPIHTQGIYLVSIIGLLAQEQPVIWRAPMANQMIMNFLQHVEWPSLDYLLIDLPPGTGDIHLTLAQKAKINGALIVTTPQKSAYHIAEKAIQMFNKVQVPILGIIENMSGYVCQSCNTHNTIFPDQGGAFLAKKYQCNTLGKIPLHHDLVALADNGKLLNTLSKKHPVRIAYRSLTENVITTIHDTCIPDKLSKIITSQPSELIIHWQDQTTTINHAYELRLHCPCAHCVDERTGQKILKDEDVPLDISIQSAERVGQYGVKITFSDGHNTGIYLDETLKTLDKQGCKKTPEFEV